MPAVALVSSLRWTTPPSGGPQGPWRHAPGLHLGLHHFPSLSPRSARDLLHVLVLGLLATIVTAALVARPAAPRTTTTTQPGSAATESQPSTLVPALTAPAPATFSPGVERWRSLAVRASNTIAVVDGATLDPNLLLALVQTESSGDPDALSDADALGLAQLRAPAFADMVRAYPHLFPRADRHDPYENLLAGGLYLAMCARVLGVDFADESGIAAALNAYNFGPTALQRLRASTVDPASLPQETRLHAARVLAAYSASKPLAATEAVRG